MGERLGIRWMSNSLSYYQIELDNTAEMFRQAHRERQQLINQWEQTIHQMRKRDEDMDRTATVGTLTPYCTTSKPVCIGTGSTEGCD